MSEDDPEVRSVLNVPAVPSVTYERNFIRTATCELRFPILIEVEHKVPVKLADALRKEYPRLDRRQNVNVKPGAGPVETENLYVFHARRGAWAVTFKASAIALETTAYTSFDEFEERLERIIKAARPTIDSDFFTRVGLRYINALPVDQAGLKGWIRDDLVSPLVGSVYGTVDAFQQEVRGKGNAGDFSFRHGIGQHVESGKQEYVLDFDFYKENVEADAVDELVRQLHDEAFNMFYWTLGPRAKEHLGASTPRKKK